MNYSSLAVYDPCICHEIVYRERPTVVGRIVYREHREECPMFTTPERGAWT